MFFSVLSMREPSNLRSMDLHLVYRSRVNNPPDLAVRFAKNILSRAIDSRVASPPRETGESGLT